MTDMKRITISLSEEIEEAIEELRKSEPFIGKSYAEIIRTLLGRGLSSRKTEKSGEK